MKKIIILNVGSSSCKFQIFTQDLTLLGKGMIERIGMKGTTLTFKANDQEFKEEKDIDHEQLPVYLENFVKHNDLFSFDDVYLMVHRVVMGGEIFKDDVVVDSQEIINKIKDLTPLAPLHNPYNASALEAFYQKYPKIKQVAVFDTTFHTTIPKENYIYPIPLELYEKEQIRKYGAHGSSHGFITTQMQKLLNKDKVTFINLHIGNGASACLIKNSKSYDTSMGLTPLAGLMMGTRSGDVDPSIAFYLINQKGYDPKEVENIYIKKSGLLGVYGKSSDMRDVIEGEKANDPRAILARNIFAKKISDHIAMYLNQVKTVDGIVFTGGIGENDKELIIKIFENFNLKKIVLKDQINNKEDINLISKDKSDLNVYIIPTNEELHMAKIGKRLINE